MKRRLLSIGILTALLFAAQSSYGQRTSRDKLITGNSAGRVKLGMTVAAVRRAVRPMRLERTSDGEGLALIAVMRDGDALMTLYAGEDDPDAKVNEKAKVEQIWVWDKAFKTRENVHPGMLIRQAEKIYGKVKTVMMSEIESREFASFSKHPWGLEFRVQGAGNDAGVYAKGKNTTSRYSSGASILSINVVGVERSFTDAGSDSRWDDRIDGTDFL
jgi:hypothetical protein